MIVSPRHPRQCTIVPLARHLRHLWLSVRAGTLLAKLRGSGFKTEIIPLTEAVRDYVQGYLVPDKRLGDKALRL